MNKSKGGRGRAVPRELPLRLLLDWLADYSFRDDGREVGMLRVKRRVAIYL